jgi:ribosome-binding protein aMBF1 (putative translation factor)
MKCCICGKEIEGHGNSPFPVAGKQCCDDCNIKVVLPYRLFLSRIRPKDTALMITPTELKLIKPCGKYFSLKELQKAVDEYIEIGPEILPDFQTVVNEEGLLIGLERNRLASILFDKEYVGNALLVPRKIFEKPEE